MNTRILYAVVVSMFVCQQVHAQDQLPELEGVWAVTELEGTWELVSEVLAGDEKEIVFRRRWRFGGNRCCV